MTLHDWEHNGWLKRHEASPGEIKNLLGIVERELRDAAVQGISLDARLGMLYNAALKLADALVHRLVRHLSLFPFPVSRFPLPGLSP